MDIPDGKFAEFLLHLESNRERYCIAIFTREAILDANVPDWRNQVKAMQRGNSLAPRLDEFRKHCDDNRQKIRHLFKDHRLHEFFEEIFIRD
jgi:hypothetical protein